MSADRETSLWTRTSVLTDEPPLSEELEVDVVVVGGGITGLTAALLLLTAGARVAVLEARKLGSGTSGYTSAHLTAALDTRYHQLESKFGREATRLVASSQTAAIDRIEALVGELGIDCDFQRVPAWLFTEQASDRRALEEESRAAARAGLVVQLTGDVPLPFATHGALRFEHQARFHPRKYLLALAREVKARGGLLFEHSRVIEFHDGTPCEVRTQQGRVRARDVLLCTHLPINRFFFVTVAAPYRSYVVTARLREEPADGLFFDTSDPYHYLRRQQTADGPLWLIGGADHKVGKKQNTSECFRTLEDYARARFDVEDFVDRWSAELWEPVDGLPYIGLNTLSRHIRVATGFSGNGLTSGTLAAMILTDQLTGRDNPWAEVYDSQRVKPIASARRFLTENLDFPRHLIGDRLKPAETRSVDEVPRGEGRLVSVNGEKLAVYRSEEGELKACSAVCTHMYCHVRWNDFEKTWDCPCHGSRFEPTGEVIDGPAVLALPRRELPEEEGDSERAPKDEGVDRHV